MPASQYAADVADLKDGGCGANAAVLFRVRGSGTSYGGYPVAAGGDHLGAWLIGAGQELIRRGWRVRGLQAIYPAPPIPGGKQFVNPAAWKTYRDVATTSAPAIVEALTAAHQRCPARSILIAGHSQGNIVLRVALKQLPRDVLDRVARVDLFSDPTSDGAVDQSLQHPSDLDGRLTSAGADTAAARLAWKAGTLAVLGGVGATVVNFRQKPYPFPGRVFQYCVPNDVVCDVNPVNVAQVIADGERMGQIHSSYAFARVGRSAALALKDFTAVATRSAAQQRQVCVDRWNALKMWSWSTKALPVKVQTRPCRLTVAFSPEQALTSYFEIKLNPRGAYDVPSHAASTDFGAPPPPRDWNARLRPDGTMRLDAPPSLRLPHKRPEWMTRYEVVRGFVVPFAPNHLDVRPGITIEPDSGGGVVDGCRVIHRTLLAGCVATTYCFAQRQPVRPGDRLACPLGTGSTRFRWTTAGN